MKFITVFIANVILTVFFLTSASAADDPVLEARRAAARKTLTKEAFQRVEPILKGLRPNQRIGDTRLEFPIFEIRQGQKVIGLVPRPDGWAGDLSGNLIGAASRLGEITGRLNGFVYGRHVYGYIISPGIFLPRYVLETRAEIISPSEYQSLKEKKVPDVAWVYMPDEEKVFVKDASVRGGRELSFSESDYKASHLGSLSPAETLTAKLFTKERYESIADELKGLPAGEDTYSVLQRLKPHIIAHNDGLAFIFFIKGYLNYKGQYRFSKTTPNAVYQVWPFGYVEDDREIAKQALIFKNGTLLEVTPYISRKELENKLN